LGTLLKTPLFSRFLKNLIFAVGIEQHTNHLTILTNSHQSSLKLTNSHQSSLKLTNSHQSSPNMSSFDLHTKLSGHEVKTWYLATLDMEVGTIDGEAAWDSFMDHKPKDFKCPRRKGGKKTSTPSCLEDAEQHDESKCDTRVYKGPSVGGWGCQCSSKKFEGGRLCKAHQNEANKNGDMVRNGFINEDRPTHHYGDKHLALIPWHDVELPEKVSKAKKTSVDGSDAPKRGKRKCSGCNQPGHTLPKCPNNSTKPSVVQSAAELKALLAAAEAREEEEAAHDSDKVEVDSDKVEVDSVMVEVDTDKAADDSDLDEDTISFGGEENINAEEKTDQIVFEFEGIQYRRGSDNVVLDDEYDPMGDWDVVNESITFNKIGKKTHKMKKAAS
jgi:hypothetical protein